MMDEKSIEQNIHTIESELRRHGDPYAVRMPDEAYFSDMQKKISERVAALTPVPKHHFSPKLTVSLSLAVLTLIIAFFYFSGSNDDGTTHPVSSTIHTNSKSEQIAQPKNNVPPAVPTTQPNSDAPAAVKTVKQSSMPVTQEQTSVPSSTVDKASEHFKALDALSVSDPDAPITYDKLSSDELEAILRLLDSEN